MPLPCRATYLGLYHAGRHIGFKVVADEDEWVVQERGQGFQTGKCQQQVDRLSLFHTCEERQGSGHKRG
jgi:hypothetical protein